MNTNFGDMDFWRDLAIIIGVLVSIHSLIKSVSEYSKQGTQKRADYFFNLQKRFGENKVFGEICSELDNEYPMFDNISLRDKMLFLGFHEEVAASMNSKLIKKEIVHYMFGYYALRCWESKEFWIDIDKDSFYWILFNEFAEQMEIVENKMIKRGIMICNLEDKLKFLGVKKVAYIKHIFVRYCF